MKHDTFFGFFKVEGKDQLVTGGRYRPFTLVMFAIERELFGEKPFAGHLINVLMFSLLIVLIFQTINTLLAKFPGVKNAGLIAFIAALLFAVHPVHTEVVANIKGRDEIMSMLFSMLTFYLVIRHADKGRIGYLLLAAISFFFGLLSKENTITFVLIIPLALFLFRSAKAARKISMLISILIPVVVFLIIRTSILGFDLGSQSMELMNNPFLKFINGQYIDFNMGEKMATIIFILGKYLQLLVFPHPLTHDYYPRHIDIMNFSDWPVLISLTMYAGLIWIAIRYLKKNKVISFGILFYLITLSIVSNIVFPIGTNMSERFIFMPSVGFTLLVAYFFDKWYNRQKILILLPSLLIFLAMSAKTIARNTVWKDDFTLFTTDVKTSVNSAKVLNAAGGSLIDRAKNEENHYLKAKYLQEAEVHLTKAIEIHPTYQNAYLLLGNAYYYQKKFEKAIEVFLHLTKILPEFEQGKQNLAVSYREAGKYLGEEKGDLRGSLKFLENAIQMLPEDYEANRLYGIANALSGNLKVALKHFQKCIELDPQNAGAYVNLGNTYFNMGDVAGGQAAHKKALELDPKILQSK
ncbi:MAG TPA: hypothetical protein DCX89_02820 [Saprospirales bacterium]|nr:hypothetical protein [Saprospirales bacterium]